MPNRTLLRLVVSIAAVASSAATELGRDPAIWAGLHAGPHKVGVARVARDGLEVTYWYPALRGGRAMRLADLSAQPDAFVDGLIRDKMPAALAKAYGESPLFARLDASRAPGRFPFLLIGQGTGQAPPDQAVLAEFLASHAFVVATMPSPTLRSPMRSADDVGPLAQRQAEELSRAASLVNDLGGVDVARMAVVGHSFGARAALLVAMHDARVSAVVSLDGGIGTAQGVESFRRAPWFDASRVIAPILHIYETADSFMSPDFTLLRRLRAPLTVEEVFGLRHVHFTTLGFKAAEDPQMGRLTDIGADGLMAIRNVAGRVLAFLERHLKTEQSVLFTDRFDTSLARWEIHGEGAVAVGDSGDPRHGRVLTLTPNGDVAALIRGSEKWGPVRVEGEMMFPSPVDNYLGFLYNFTTRGRRRDFGLIYVKGNDSYLQVNPHRDFNVSRLIYPEYHVDLTGPAAIVTGSWRKFAFEVSGSTTHVYVGDASTPQLTFSALELRRGAVGLQPRSVGGPVWVDNVVVRGLPRLSYAGPPIPSHPYQPNAVITEWMMSGPLQESDDRVARNPSSATWTRFATDERGAVVTGRVVDYHGRRTVAYFLTGVESATAGEAELEISTADDLAVWMNGRFASFVSRQDAAWFDFLSNKAHAPRRVPLRLNAGRNEIVLRVRGGVYASGGFFARIVRPCQCCFPLAATPR